MFFLIIFAVYFLTNPILNDKIKKLLKTIKGLTIKKPYSPGSWTRQAYESCSLG
jgi:hypothetical protein